MKKRKNILRFLKFIYLKLFRINDTPQKIALGFSLGVFLGVLPGTGPLAALFLAFILRINRAAAFLGSLLTNTWLSVVTFLLSIKIGSIIMNLNWQDVYRDCSQIFKQFHFSDLLKISVLKIFLPVILGYVVISFCAGLAAYFFMLVMLNFKLRRKS